MGGIWGEIGSQGRCNDSGFRDPFEARELLEPTRVIGFLEDVETCPTHSGIPSFGSSAASRAVRANWRAVACRWERSSLGESMSSSSNSDRRARSYMGSSALGAGSESRACNDVSSELPPPSPDTNKNPTGWARGGGAAGGGGARRAAARPGGRAGGAAAPGGGD